LADPSAIPILAYFPVVSRRNTALQIGRGLLPRGILSLLLAGEETLEVFGASFVLSDDLTPLPALANLNSWYFSVKSRSAGFPSIPSCLKELGTV
jgi:hypothetical protein